MSLTILCLWSKVLSKTTILNTTILNRGHNTGAALSCRSQCCYGQGVTRWVEYTSQLRQVSRQFFVYPQSICKSTGVPLYHDQSPCLFYPLSAPGYPTFDFPTSRVPTLRLRVGEWHCVCLRFCSAIHQSILSSIDVIVVSIFSFANFTVDTNFKIYSWPSRSWLKLASETMKPTKVKNILSFSIF